MRVALIPPTPDLGRYATTGIHLLLSQQFTPEYVRYYRRRRRAGDYLILDNAAHENGAGNGHDMLLGQAWLVGAQEVVCPDVLFDHWGTLDRTAKMLRYIRDEGRDEYATAYYPRLMLVPQGSNEKEWQSCLQYLIALWERYMSHVLTDPPVIGISKDYPNLPSLIAPLYSPYHVDMGIDVHCLGWPTDLWTLAEIKRECPWVRSTDSAKPFVYAKAGIMLEPGGKIPQYPHRSHDYFTTPVPDHFCKVARANIEVFKATANDELITEDVHGTTTKEASKMS